jgi:hypothetical protein
MPFDLTVVEPEEVVEDVVGSAFWVQHERLWYPRKKRKN